MAEFTADWQTLRPSSFPFLDIDNMELINHFKGVNPHILDNSILNMQNLMPFSSDSFLCSSEPEFHGNFEENLPGLVHHFNQNAAPVSPPISSVENEGKKRKATSVSGPSSANSTPAVSESESKIKNSSGRGKRVKKSMTEEEDKKSTQVVHVRARRGQATDSHSLAERVRRGKINEKLKCLQNIVPGCYKTMGMAIMLDEIINYVQSLQHQVEFLSMKLTAASTYYDFNSEIDALEAMQRAKVSEAKELAKYVTEGYEGVSCFQPTWP